MNSPVWLPLIEYSGKHRVSMSTLRRRIKAGEVEYQFADGKYFIKDGPLETSSGTETIAPPTSMSQVQGNQKAAASTTLKHSVPNAAASTAYSSQVATTMRAEMQKPLVVSMPPAAAAPAKVSMAPQPQAAPAAQPSASVQSGSANEPSQKGYWEATQTLLAEIKKAYSLILQEKEEQILQLKEEVSDLKTLVRVLEDETLHQKRKSAVKTDFDLDLELGLDI